MHFCFAISVTHFLCDVELILGFLRISACSNLCSFTRVGSKATSLCVEPSLNRGFLRRIFTYFYNVSKSRSCTVESRCYDLPTKIKRVGSFSGVVNLEIPSRYFDSGSKVRDLSASIQRSAIGSDPSCRCAMLTVSL